jgi:integrase
MIVLNKKKIKKYIGEYRKMHRDRAYDDKEIKKLVDVGDFRLKAIVLLLASSGIRIGSVESLKVRHLEDKGDVYRVTIYENTKEEYFTFTTPEAKKAIDEYLDYRR